MEAFAIKSAGRAIARRSHSQNRQNLTKRYKTNQTTTRHDSPTRTSIPVLNTVPSLPVWQRLGPLSTGFQTYGRSQRKRPYMTQFVSSLVIYFLGDLSAQKINGEYDPKRTLRALIIGAGSSIPSYQWFMFLGNHFNYPSKILSLATKVLVNQAIFTPINNTWFFGMQAFLAGDSFPEVWERIKRAVPISMINSVKLWPAITAFTFSVVDAQYRYIFAGVIAIGWQTYLSFLNRESEVAQARERAHNMVRS